MVSFPPAVPPPSRLGAFGRGGKESYYLVVRWYGGSKEVVRVNGMNALPLILTTFTAILMFNSVHRKWVERLRK